MISLAVMVCCLRAPVARASAPLLFHHAEDVILAQNQQFLAVDRDVGAAVLREQHAVAHLQIELAYAAVFEHAPVADSEHLAFDRLFLGSIGYDNSTLGLFLIGDPGHDDTVLKRTNAHGLSPVRLRRRRFATTREN